MNVIGYNVSAFWIAGCLAVAVASPLARGQGRNPPHLGFLYPAGGQQGTTFTVAAGGQSLAGATAAFVSGAGVHVKVIGYDRPLAQKEISDLREKLQQLQARRTAARADPAAAGFTADDEKALEQTRATLATRGSRPANPALAETVTLEITLAPDSSPGTRELRLRTTAGLSNPMVFCVGALPETTAPVVTATAKPLRPAPAANRGPAANRNETPVVLPALLNGQILPGEVDRFRFAARRGQHVTVMTAARALIPYLADAVPGWFQPTVAVLDNTGREVAYADDFRFHPDPALGCAIPADGDYVIEIKDAIFRGREDFVYRISVGEIPFVTALFPLGGRAGAPFRVEALGWNLPRNEFVIDTGARGRGIFELAVRNGGAMSNPVRVAVDEHASWIEEEPNNAPAAAHPLSLPLTVDGRIGAPGDADMFRFDATAPGPIVAEVVARRLNSPLDSTLEVFDHSGRRLAQNDDFEDKGAGLLTHHADSRVHVMLPAAGTYFVRVTDAQRHGGPEYAYRLRLAPPEPDFALRIVPSTINLRAGSTAILTAYALRRDGFTGEVALGLKDAPKGFLLSGNRIPAGEESVRLTITAPPLPVDAPGTLTVVGMGAAPDGRRLAHVAVPADDMMQAFASRHLVPAHELKVQLSGRGAALRVLSAQPVALKPGGETRIRIGTPPARAVGEVKLELLEPPPGVSVVRCDRRPDHVEIVVRCDAASARPDTQGNLIFQAVGERSGTTKSKAKSGGQRSVLGIVPAIAFEILGQPGPFSGQ